MERDLPAYGDPSALAEIGRRFGYAFEPLSARAKGYYYKPVLQAEAIDGPFIVAGIDVVPFVQDPGYSTTLGFWFVSRSEELPVGKAWGGTVRSWLWPLV